MIMMRFTCLFLLSIRCLCVDRFLCVILRFTWFSFYSYYSLRYQKMLIYFIWNVSLCLYKLLGHFLSWFRWKRMLWYMIMCSFVDVAVYFHCSRLFMFSVYHLRFFCVFFLCLPNCDDNAKKETGKTCFWFLYVSVVMASKARWCVFILVIMIIIMVLLFVSATPSGWNGIL